MTISLSSYYEKILATGEVKCIDEEIPFEIPQGWEWCRLRDIIIGTNAGKSPNCEKRPRRGEEWGVLTTTAIQENDFLPNENKILPLNYIVNPEHSVKYGDILITRAGPLNRTGVVCLVDKECDNLILSDKTVRIDYLRNYCNPIFIVLVLNSPAIHELLMSVSVGMAASQVNVSQGNIQNTLIPLPCIKEQNHIVAKITNLLPIIKRYNSEQERLEELNSQLPSSLKKSILQEAIQGKLVPQIAEEGTAQELLEQIREEKQKLVKEGKLKKSALADSVIYKGDDNRYYEQIGKEIKDITEEIPFEIPSSWQWCRLSNVILLLSGRDLAPDCYNSENSGIPYITGASNFRNGELLINRWTNKPVTISHKNDLLITCKGTIGELAFNTIGDVHIARQIMSISGIIVELNYIKYFLQTIITLLEQQANSMIPGISRETLLSSLLPLPPLPEQERIAQRINDLFQLLK